jgi:hypothetical protein
MSCPSKRASTRRALSPRRRRRGVYEQLYGAFADEPNSMEFYETVHSAPTNVVVIAAVDLGDESTVDHSVWVVLARPGDDPTASVTRSREDPDSRNHAGSRGCNARSSPGGPPADQAKALPIIYEIATGNELAGDRRSLRSPRRLPRR